MEKNSRNTEEKIKDWWDISSDYYQKEIIGDKMEDVNYGPFGSNERKLRLLGNVKSKRILDLGCGGGQTSIALAKKGAVCTGIDISEKQLEKAARNAEKANVNVKFLRLPFSSIGRIRGRRFDIVISVMSLQYCSDLKSLFKHVNKLLEDNGIFVFSIEHPFYLLIDPDTMKLTESYFSEGIRKDFSDEEKVPYIYFYNKISTIVNLLISSGFSIENIEEPMDKPDRIWGSGYRAALVNRIGPTVIFKARK